jgi:tetratricopeptide (TPR) repeat protein
MKRLKFLSSFIDGDNSWVTRLSSFLLIAMVVFFMVCCGPVEKFKYDLVKMDRKQLEQELEVESKKDSKRKVDILNELSYRLNRIEGISSPPEKDALTYARNAWCLAKKIDYQEGIIDSRCSLGYVYLFRSEYKESLAHYETGLDLAKNFGYRRGQAMAYNGIARYYQVKGLYEKALENFIQGKEISEKIGEWRELAYANYGFGALYNYDSKNYREAHEFFEKCLELGKKIMDNTLISSGYYGIGEMCRSLKRYQIAKEYFELCRKNSLEYGNKYNEANAHEGYGDTYRDEKNQEEALKFYQKSLENFEKIGDQYQLMGIKFRLGRLYIEMGNYKAGLEYLEEVYTLATAKDIPLRIKDSCEEIIKAYEKTGNNQNIQKYFQDFNKSNELLINNNMQKLQILYAHKKKSDEDKMISIFGISGFFILFTAFVLALWNAGKLARQKKDIARMSEIG